MKTHWQVSFTGQMSVLRQDFTNLDIECTLSLPQAGSFNDLLQNELSVALFNGDSEIDAKF